MSDLTSKTIAELRDGFRGGDYKAREIAEAFNAAVVAGRALKYIRPKDGRRGGKFEHL